MVATVILIATQIVLITTYQSRYYDCPTIKRIIAPEVSAKELSVKDKIILYAEGKVNVATALRIADCESKTGTQLFNPNSSAKGIYQFIDKTWANYCEGDVLNADDNIKCFVKLYSTHPEWWQCK
jgi:hypothetical protein